MSPNPLSKPVFALVAGLVAAAAVVAWSERPRPPAGALPPEPAAEQVRAEAPAPPLVETRVVVRRGDTLPALVGRAGLGPLEAAGLREALQAAVDPRKIRPGQALVVAREADGTLGRAAYESSSTEVVDVHREGLRFLAAPRAMTLVTTEARVSVTIDGSLWEAFEAAGENPALAAMASDVLAWELDFYRDLRPGDRMDLLVEKTSHDGRFVRYGDLLALRFTGAAGTKTFFRFAEGGRAGFYDAEGRSARRAFLKQPLPLVRITSRFGGRVHPVLGYFKQHEGVDYGAPTGTPVWTVGDGIVQFAGRKGPNGNLVSVKHANGYTSHYAHLSRIGSGIRAGIRVTQKQVIGLVGATGRATGPHLHFALSKGGTFLNPLAQKFAAGEGIPKSESAAFQGVIAPLAQRLVAGPMVAARVP